MDLLLRFNWALLNLKSVRVFTTALTIFVTALIGFHPEASRAENFCSLALKGANGTPAVATIDEAEIEKEVQIIWYPNSDYFYISHVNIIVDKIVWDSNERNNVKSNEEATERSARGNGKGYLSFHLKVSPNEFQNISTYLRTSNDKLHGRNCSRGACYIVTKNSGIVIPFPFSQVPTLMASYLTLTKKMGYSRVTKIEWVGKKNLKQFLTIQPFAELVYTFIGGSVVGGLTFLGYDLAQNLIKTVVPVVLSSFGFSQNDLAPVCTAEDSAFS